MGEAVVEDVLDNGADANRLNANNETPVSFVNSERTRE